MDRTLFQRIEKHEWVRLYPRGGPVLLFLFTALATFIAVAALERADTLRHRMALENYATEVAASVERRAMQQLSVLHAASAVFALRGEVTEQEFGYFGTRLRETNAFGRSRVLGWLGRVPAVDIPRFEAAMQESGAQGFRIFPRPQTGRRWAFPLLFVDPATDANRSYIGYDLYSDPLLREAMDRSTAIGEPVATARLKLVDRARAGTASGILIFMPVFQQSETDKSLKGFAYTSIEADDLLVMLAATYGGTGKHISLYDERKVAANLLAERGPKANLGPPIDRELKIANRKWILSVSSTERSMLSDLARATLVFGLVLSFLVAFIARMITRRAAEDRELLDWYTRQAAIRTSLSRELNHRVKNTLANVLSIVALTRRRATGIDDFAESLIGRLRALSATQDLLSQADWREANIGELIRAELAPYIDDEAPRVTLQGPEIGLAPNDALSLGLAIHELATNAAKYGALSAADGKVHVEWHLETPEVVAVAWREEGGPAVSPPAKRGFGIELIEKIVSQELNSKVELQFLPGGVQCRLRVPVRKRTDFVLRSQAG